MSLALNRGRFSFFFRTGELRAGAHLQEGHLFEIEGTAAGRCRVAGDPLLGSSGRLQLLATALGPASKSCALDVQVWWGPQREPASTSGS